MKQSVILNTEQVTRLKETGSVVVVDMVKLPDCTHVHLDYVEADWIHMPMTLVESPNNAGCYYCKYCGNGAMNKLGGIPAPYALNGTVYVRETRYALGFWQYPEGNENSNCKEDSPWFWQKEIVFDIPKDTKMQSVKISPATMPKKAARLFPVVEKVECVRCNEFLFPTYPELEQFYLKCGIKKIPLSKPFGVNKQEFVFDWKEASGTDEYLYNNCLWSARAAFSNMICERFGQSFWDNNGWIFLTTLKLNK